MIKVKVYPDNFGRSSGYTLTFFLVNPLPTPTDIYFVEIYLNLIPQKSIGFKFRRDSKKIYRVPYRQKYVRRDVIHKNFWRNAVKTSGYHIAKHGANVQDGIPSKY